MIVEEIPKKKRPPRPKIGDVYELYLDGGQKAYFHLINFDTCQLDSAVIRVFARRWPRTASPSMQEALASEVAFHSHVFISFGYSTGLWQKAGSAPVTVLDALLWRDTPDYGVGPGQEPVKLTDRWRLWRSNDREWREVKRPLSGEEKEAEIGLVYAPNSVIYRLQNGHHRHHNYPEPL